MKSILITGGAGYIGSAIASHLYLKNKKIIIIDSLLHNQEINFLNKIDAKFYKADFADSALLDKILPEVDAVIHCAAHIEVGRSVKEPADFYDNNVTKTIYLLNKMMQHNINKIIFSSSCAVYGTPKKLPLTEDHQTDTISPYGKTKLIIEYILQDYAKAYNLSYAALRYFNASGAIPEYAILEQHKPETHIIPLLFEAAYNNKIFNIFGDNYNTPDGSCIRDYLHIKDLADAHSKALEYIENGGPSQAFNLGTGRGYSVKELISVVEQITGKKINCKILPSRAGDPDILVADAGRANKLLKWQPIYSDLAAIICDVNTTFRDTFCISCQNRKGNLHFCQHAL